MNGYFLKCGDHRPDPSLTQLADSFELPVEEFDIGQDAEAVIPLLRERDPGIVFIPPVWEDLFCVKVVNSVQTLASPFETVIAGRQPIIPNLVAAYNAGLTAYVELPVNNDLFRQVLQRSQTRLDRKAGEIRAARRMRELETGAAPGIFSPQIQERDHLLSRAFMDLIQRKGPLVVQSVRLLLVTSSEAQRQRFGGFLSSIGLKVTTAVDMKEALKAIETGFPFSIVISDNILPDGDAIGLVNAMRKQLKEEMPRFIVLTASPDKAAELLSPETHIDDLIVKPGPGHSIEMILPSVIAGIYQVRW